MIVSVKRKIQSLIDSRYQYIYVALFFIVLGFYKSHPVLLNEGYSFTSQGDGLGGISLVFAITDEFFHGNWKILFGDEYHLKRIGLGIPSPGHLNPYWKWNFFLFGFIFSPDNVYDFNGLIGFVLIGFVGFILLREVGANLVFSFLGAILLANLDVFSSRLNGHLFGLATYYAPLLLIFTCIRACKNPTTINWILFALANLFNFLNNEYYGYFGIYFVSVICIGYIALNRNRWLDLKFFGLHLIIIFILVSACLFIIFYPYQIGGRIYESFSSSVVKVRHVHNWNNFAVYSLENLAAIFDPLFLRNEIIQITGDDYFSRKDGLTEFTYRIGWIVPVIAILFSIILFIANKFAKKNIKTKSILNQSLVWCLAMFFTALLGISPKFNLSLVPFTFKIAQMFRVGVRAFLYVDIAIIIMATLLSSHAISIFTEWLRKKYSGFKFANLLIVSLALVLFLISFRDISLVPITGLFAAKKLPPAESYKKLENMPDALLIELPFFSPITSVPEKNYIYFYNRICHKKPIVNLAYTGSTNTKHKKEIHDFSILFNKPNNEVIKMLANLGVRYFVANSHAGYDFSFLDKTKLLEMVSENESRKIYRIRDNVVFQPEIQ